MGRGQLTDDVKKLSKKLLGYEISQVELRLMPYLQYCLMNNKRISPNSVNNNERSIFSRWREQKFITGGAGSDLTITKKFWNIINEILFISYVDI